MKYLIYFGVGVVLVLFTAYTNYNKGYKQIDIQTANTIKLLKQDNKRLNISLLYYKSKSITPPLIPPSYPKPKPVKKKTIIAKNCNLLFGC